MTGVDKEGSLILTTAYYPPVEHFTLMTRYGSTLIEDQENYLKQSYRNRCVIYGANGPLQLTVPVERGSFHKVHIRDLRIDNSVDWAKNHVRAITSAYNRSAFFEFYFDEIERFFTDSFTFLLDLNTTLTSYFIELLEIPTELSFTGEFIDNYNLATDRRYGIHPKRPSSGPSFDPPAYFQAFSPKGGFIPNLSILDLLFNMGPESYGYLTSCLRSG